MISAQRRGVRFTDGPPPPPPPPPPPRRPQPPPPPPRQRVDAGVSGRSSAEVAGNNGVGVPGSRGATGSVTTGTGVSGKWEVPAFSPTQAPKQEQVLHSIFSPGFKSKPDPVSKNLVDEMGQENVSPHNRNMGYPSEVIVRPSVNKPGTKTKSNETDYAGGSDFYHTPGPPMSPLCNTTNDDDDDDRDVFFSSQAPIGFSPLSRMSGASEPTSASIKTNRTNSSFKTLETIEMLNYAYVQKCQKESDLERVIDALKNEQERSSSSLLHAAEKRLETLRHELNAPRTPAARNNDRSSAYSPGQTFLHNLLPNISRITNGNCTLDSIQHSEGTLIMSLSPSSVLQGIEFVDTSGVEGGKNNDSVASTRLRPIAESNTPATRTQNKDRALSEEVKRLTKEAIELETSRMAEQKNFLAKLRNLDQAKKQAEETVNNLNGKVATASIRAKDLIDSWHKVQQENQHMRQNLEHERVTMEQKIVKTREQEERLRRKLNDLTEAMNNNKEQSRLKVGAERCLRMRAEQSLSENQRHSAELNAILVETRQNLENLKREHGQFRSRLLLAIGVEDSMAHKIRTLPQREFLNSLSQKVSSINAEREELAKALEKSEEDRRRVVAKQQLEERHLQESLKCQRTLEKENQLLTQKIQSLVEEVASSRAYIDKLLKTARDTHQSDWERRELQYKTVIRNLRQQLLKENTMVSIDLYKAAIDDGRQKVAELKVTQEKVSALSSTLSQLKKDLKENSENRATKKTPKKAPQRGAQAALAYFGSPTDILEQGLLGANVSEFVRPSESLSRKRELRGQESRRGSEVASHGDLVIAEKQSLLPNEARTPSERRGEIQRRRPKTPGKSNGHRNDDSELKGNTAFQPGTAEPEKQGIMSWVENYAAANLQKTPAARQSKPKDRKAETKPFAVESVIVYNEKRQTVAQGHGACSTGGVSVKSQKKVERREQIMGLSAKLASVERGLLESTSIRPSPLRMGESHSQKNVRAATTPRFAKVLAAGGRKGLSDQLSKMRSPPYKDRAPLREVNR